MRTSVQNVQNIREIPDTLAQAVGDGFFALWPLNSRQIPTNSDLVPKRLPLDAPIDKWGWATCPRCAKGFRFFKHRRGTNAIYCLGCARY